MDRLDVSRHIRDIAEKGRIDEDDVAELRHNYYVDGAAHAVEADNLLWLNELCEDACPEWPELFVEALTDFFVHQRRPRGYIDEDGAEEIAHRLLRDGRIRTSTELELLVSIVSNSRSVPEKLILFAIGEIRVSVLEGEGPIRRGQKLEPGVIADAEVDLLRRLIYAMGSDGNVKVTKLEAELLFDLNDSIAGAENHEAWAGLFVSAIANYIMAAELWEPLPAAEVVRREAWLEQREGAIGFMRRLAESGIGGALDALKVDADGEAAMRRAAREEEIARAAEITAEEAEWLARRIGRDGTIHENERAVLRRLKDEAGTLHPALRALVNRAA